VVSGYETIVAKFHTIGTSRPVELDALEQARLRVPLEFWNQTHPLSDGLAHLLAALLNADPEAKVRFEA
jgi:hypothetical protein